MSRVRGLMWHTHVKGGRRSVLQCCSTSDKCHSQQLSVLIVNACLTQKCVVKTDPKVNRVMSHGVAAHEIYCPPMTVPGFVLSQTGAGPELFNRISCYKLGHLELAHSSGIAGLH